ncbi:alpha/beta fold hydrolase [Dongia sedimenti]|uniref:Alpha/beta hydrolase n=1 Tax=Dongia sedimenti TaxID=3064282 RepID=A0ABU0YQZ7_9PROT|nr:alpha/beta hydrolase [Rhodospirillaceae bacterium R-7]
MVSTDDDLKDFAANGLALPAGGVEAVTLHQGARIWHADYGTGKPVILLHGGLGHAGNWGKQVPALVAASMRAVVIDSRGHGRSARDERPFSYERMAGDVLAVMDALHIEQAALLGWSDGACTALELARQAPQRVAGVFFFACNVDPTGTKELDESNPLLGRCFTRHKKDYAALSPTPEGFAALLADLGTMQRSQPDYGAADLAAIKVPVWSVIGENDEFIKRDHAEHIAKSIPGAQFREIPGVSHFAPIQRPALFNATVLEFLGGLDR